jgi:hypothetical protein
MHKREMNIISIRCSSKSGILLALEAISFAKYLSCYAPEFAKIFCKPSLIINSRDLQFFPLHKWMEIIGQAHQNVEFLKDQDVIRTVLNILQV